MKTRLLVLVLLGAAATGCAGRQGMYHWGAYDSALYAHYQNPTDREPWITALKTTILEAEQEGLRVPPGLYAEYGYALVEEGNSPQAIVYFQKEKAKWPESAVLMDKMIRNAGQRPAKAGAGKGPASRVEAKP
jgi:hypothetical protein